MSEDCILKYSKHSIPKYCPKEYISEQTVAMTNSYGPITYVDPHTKRNGEPYPNDDIKRKYENSGNKRKKSLEPMHLPTKKKVEYVPKPNTVTIKKHKKSKKYKKEKYINALRRSTYEKINKKTKTKRAREREYEYYFPSI